LLSTPSQISPALHFAKTPNVFATVVQKEGTGMPVGLAFVMAWHSLKWATQPLIQPRWYAGSDASGPFGRYGTAPHRTSPGFAPFASTGAHAKSVSAGLPAAGVAVAVSLHACRR
jgi:hypothetical protein